MIAHIPILLRYLASGYSLDAALGISAITHRTECSIFRRTFAETFGVKYHKFPASLLVYTWAQPGQLPVPLTIPPAFLRLPDPSLSCFFLDIPQQFHSHSAPPQAPSRDVSGAFPSSPHSLTPSLLFSHLWAVSAPFCSFSLSPTTGLSHQVFLQNKFVYKLYGLSISSGGDGG